VEDLARKIGVDATGLAETIRAHNEYARSGVDAAFGKGNNSYDRGNGDPAHTPNPCLGPIQKPPYCAVAVLPTPLGTSLGVRTDAHGRVLDGSDRPIGGLYACGKTALVVVRGSAGAELGLAWPSGILLRCTLW
jgi:predicted oxidoreductase